MNGRDWRGSYEFGQGRGAFLDGRAKHENPYDRLFHPNRHASWKQGWEYARGLGVDNDPLFTPREVEAARRLLRQGTEAVRDAVVTPEVMARIDRVTGQKNDRTYMTYRLIHSAGEKK